MQEESAMTEEELRRREELYEELEREPECQELDENLERITTMVYEYNEKIKAHLKEEQEKRTSLSERIADRIAAFGGSWTFIVIFATFLIGWMIWNTLSFTFHFDDPPFILMNLVLSCLAAFQAPVILMSQNRQAARDKQEAIMDFAINYKAEQENLELKQILKRIEHRLEQLEQQEQLERPGRPGRIERQDRPEQLEKEAAPHAVSPRKGAGNR